VKARRKETTGKKQTYKDNITMDLRTVGWDGADWIDLAEDRHQWRAPVNTVTNHRIPQNLEKFLCSVSGGFSTSAQRDVLSNLLPNGAGWERVQKMFTDS
jgi:hypothetical protein